ncbi:S-layer homology domain-containing protein [Cohnella abietis]|uniref:SLH domain-containing protein n=1 Tax=Cohnella abietis TaxID=2507935 RepID=A0A3T1DDQ6_9BACL|nr:SwmB domain-containing protein [Cohnella abietis]BBI36164.1 hypothetical protein KCTCHS21_55630 [Cohnella abietis]
MQRIRTLSLTLIVALVVQCLSVMVAAAAPVGSEVRALGGDNGPQLTGMTPSNGATAVVTNTFLKLSFDETIIRGTGTIDLYLANGTLVGKYNVTDVNTVQLDNENTSIVIKPSTLNSGDSYYVIVPSTAIISYATGRSYQGLTTSQWTFRAEQLVPVASNFSPRQGANAVDPVAPGNLSFDFTRKIFKGTSGYIEVKRTADNVTVQSIDIASNEVTIAPVDASPSSNWRVSAPLKGLDYNTSYYVLINPGALKDADNGAYAGITAVGVWAFTTKPALDTTKPKAVVFNPANNGTLGDIKTTQFTLTFDKPVFVNANKSLVILNAANNALFCTIPADSTTTGGSSISINLATSSCPKLTNNLDLSISIANDVFRDASGNYFDGVTWRFKIVVDSTPPTIVSYLPAVGVTTVGVSTTQLSLTFNKPVALVGANPTSQVFPQNNQTYKTDLKMVIDPTNSSRVLFNLGNSKLSSSTLYSVLVPVNLITDLAGNAFAGIANPYQWTFQTANNSTPTISSSTIDGSTILLTYSENLDSTKVPSGSNFYVQVNDVARPVTSVSIVNNEVRLVLQSIVLAGQSVKVSYYPDSFSIDKRLKNVAGNEAAGFTNRAVTNTTDTALPKPVSGIFSGSSVLLMFNRALTTPVGEYRNQFVVKQGGVPLAFNASTLGGTVLSLTLNTTSTSPQPVSISYTPGSNPIRDQNGNLMPAFTDYYIRNVLDTTEPQFVSATLNGNKVILTYNEGLNTTTIPPKSSFSLTISGTAAIITSVNIVNNTVELLLSQSVTSNVPVQLFYYPGSPGISDLSGNPALAIVGHSFNSGAAGAVAQVASLNISNSQLSIVYSTNLSSYSTPYITQYTVKYDGVAVPVTNISVSGTQVILTLSSAVKAGQRVTVSYSSTGVTLKDYLSQQVAVFNDLTVTNQGGSAVIGNLPDYLETDGAGALRFINAKAATVVSAATASGRSANRYMINGDKLISAFDLVKTTAGVTVPMVTFKVPTTEAGALVGIPLRSIMDAASRSANASIRLDFGDLQFTLPLKAINYSKQLQATGGDVSAAYLLLNIEKTPSTPLVSKLSGKGAQMLVTPADFTAIILAGGREREIDSYEAYVTRTFVLPSSVGATNDIAVVRMDSDSGDVTYVPSKVSNSNGSVKVDFMRKGNSVYAAIRANITYTDMAKHWARDDVSQLASKFIVDGPSLTSFAPNKAITRADFAVFIARGLGLNGVSASAAKFKDVGSNYKSAAYIGAVSDAGIVEGGTDGKFRPEAPVTREEMATMLVRAMKYAGVSKTATSTALNGFKDRTKISSWAKDGMAISVTAGFIKGTPEKTVNPKNNATRAEAAIMIKRFLEYVDFL